MKVLDIEAKHKLLRKQRETECFPIVNRGPLWYNTLTSSQRLELKKWYYAWLKVTETEVIPKLPDWINKVNMEEKTW